MHICSGNITLLYWSLMLLGSIYRDTTLARFRLNYSLSNIVRITAWKIREAKWKISFVNTLQFNWLFLVKFYILLQYKNVVFLMYFSTMEFNIHLVFCFMLLWPVTLTSGIVNVACISTCWLGIYVLCKHPLANPGLCSIQ